VVTLQPKSSVRSPAKGSTAKQVQKESSSSSNEEKKSTTTTSSVPYIRRVSKKDKNKWGTENDEETALCHVNPIHEVSIVSSTKDESTVV